MGLFEFCKGIFDGWFLISWYLISKFLKLFFSCKYHTVSSIDLIDLFLCLFIGFCVCLCLIPHSLDFIITQTGRCFYSDSLLLTGTAVFGCYMQNSVGINIKCHFNLRHASWCRRDAIQMKTSDCLVS